MTCWWTYDGAPSYQAGWVIPLLRESYDIGWVIPRPLLPSYQAGQVTLLLPESSEIGPIRAQNADVRCSGQGPARRSFRMADGAPTCGNRRTHRPGSRSASPLHILFTG